MSHPNTNSVSYIPCLKLPYVVFDYSKCNGDGACTNSCPNSAFELSPNRRWCRPKDDLVRNSEAVDSYLEMVQNASSQPTVAIRYQIPACLLCWQCIGACPTKAIGVEYDAPETREYVIQSPVQGSW